MCCRHCLGQNAHAQQIEKTVVMGSLMAVVLSAPPAQSHHQQGGNAGLRTAARRRRSSHAFSAEQRNCSRPLRSSSRAAPRLGSRHRGFRRGRRSDHAWSENEEVLRPRARRCSEEGPRRAAGHRAATLRLPDCQGSCGVGLPICMYTPAAFDSEL